MKSTKTMLVAALAVSALLACSSSLRAEDAPSTPPAGAPPAGQNGPGMKGGRPDIAKALDLTDEQKPKVEAIMKSSMEKRKALREDTALTPEDRKAKMKTIQEETATQMKAVLTPEQFAKFEKMRSGHPPGGAGGAGAGGPPAGDKPAKN